MVPVSQSGPGRPNPTWASVGAGPGAGTLTGTCGGDDPEMSLMSA
ncbi:MULTISPECIES: hypothetical protein [unclassified Streptomyces]|nr:hypothetical protein OG254_09525 [Streptomyces sp. NBC_01092]